MENRERWEALAALLTRQRITVLGERSRAAFAKKVGVSDSVLAHLESAKRDNYDLGTLLSLETWYGLSASDLRGVLGDLYPIHEVVTHHDEGTIQSSRSSPEQTMEQLQASIDQMMHTLDSMKKELGNLYIKEQE